MEFKKEDLPKHIAIILDGNRRWAKAKGLPTSQGHKAGVKALEKVVRYANKIGLEYITVYAFSTENWKRTQEEVSAIMMLMQGYLDDYSKRADSENIRMNFIGDREKLPLKMQKRIEECIERTKNNTGITFNIALNYGGRLEIIKAIKEIAEEVKDGKISIDNIDEEMVSSKLYTAGQPDPDLVIRTSGEMRLSNFMLWQCAYAELYFTKILWPDFGKDELIEAIYDYQNRERRFGKV